MRLGLLIGTALAILVADAALAQFTGKFELAPPGCESAGQCTLTYNLLFKDPQGLEWQADARDKTDGATIPPWAQPIVGKPFDPMFVKAAAIHDHYCDRHVRSWRATHRVFYDALIATGVDVVKSKVMYYAVYLGGPKWVKLIVGKPCGTGMMCTNHFQSGVDGPKTSIGSGDHFLTRSAQYDEPGFSNELAEVQKLLAANPASVTLEDLEMRAKQRRPNDFYYKNDSEIALGTQLEIK